MRGMSDIALTSNVLSNAFLATGLGKLDTSVCVCMCMHACMCVCVHACVHVWNCTHTQRPWQCASCSPGPSCCDDAVIGMHVMQCVHVFGF